MRHIAVVAGPDPGHALPCLALAAALRRRGHRVTFASGRDHVGAAAAADVGFLELPLLAPTAHDHDMGHRLWGRAGEMAPPLAESLRRDVPDVVVADVLTRAGAFAAELLDRPWVELSPHHLMEPGRDIPPVGLGRQPSRTPWRRLDDARIRRLQRGSLAAGRAHARRVRRSLGLPPDGGEPLVRLVATLPGLEYPRGDWPADAHVVGAMDLDPPWPPLTPPAGDLPLVIVTDSTASGVGTSLAAVALDAFRGADVRLVVTTGREDLSPGRHAVVGRGPHGPLLDAAAVAVGPGGHGFVGKALTRGVPLVVVPGAGDQRETAARLRWSGAGIAVGGDRLTPRRLRWAVLRVLHDDRYRAAARRLAAGARGLGPDRAADLVEGILADGQRFTR